MCAAHKSAAERLLAMINFTYSMPVELVFGRGGEHKVGELIRKYGGSRVLIHYGGGSARRSGLLDKIEASLKEADLWYIELGGVVPNPRLSKAKEGIEICRKEHIDFILAVGGGSVIDSAKCISIGVYYEGDVWDYYIKNDMPTATKGVMLGTVLTIAAAGSESDNGSVMTRDEDSHKMGYSCPPMFPKFSILNPENTYTLNAWQTAAGATDLIAHVFGAYIVKDWDNILAESLIEEIIKNTMKYAPIAIREPENYMARAQLMLAATECCNGSHTMGIKTDGVSHTIEHELSALYDITHGAGLAIVMPAWFKYLVKYAPERFAKFAHNIMGVEYDYDDLEGMAYEGIARFENWLRSIGMPTRLGELNIDDSRFEEMAERIDKHTGTTPFYSRIKPFTKEDTLAVLRLCL